ncbi:GNAT family N-acetyltransferase [Microbacterium azadirachtae]|uniref:Enhanced intracellular survival protein n=1 Tax=Microbacterium azadirachtae TaxID=582680 RepID=A0A0F0LCX0_9MICO|nr:GNAT family N-acetyltransferase [Microbacterium azadirachtae]KJL30988.1 Enhanced intracellular survival protein [Microbacterium azadirachtae]
MADLDARDVPVDPTSQERLSASRLEYRVVDLSDPAQLRGFARADARGFLDKEPDDETIRVMGEMMSGRRNIGVYAPGADLPVATVDSWVTPMTVPGDAGAHLDMWAISIVTVAATHRRRGIARNLLEGELRAAASAGVPIAGLTATEATIYGRYGFGPAIPVSRVRVDARRAGGVTLPAADGATTVEYLEPEALLAALGEVHERARLDRPGDIPGWPLRWRRMAGLVPGDERSRAVRGVRAVDADGGTRGVLAYTLDELPDEFGADFAIRHLDAETPEALRALWAFAVNHDLIRTVHADLRPIDDPLPWLVANQRAVQTTVHDHGWLRILDVPAVLGARSYRAPLDLVLRVSDPLGLAEGSWRLRVGQDGKGVIDVTTDAPDVELGVDALSSLYLGGVSAPTLRAAGRISASAETAAAIQNAFGTAAAPALTIWY